MRRAGEFADLCEYRFHFSRRGSAGEIGEAEGFLFDFGTRQRVAGIAARFVDPAMQNATVVSFDGDFADPSGRICVVDFGIENHGDVVAEGRDARVIVVIFKLSEAGTMEDGYEPEHCPHGEFGLMHRLGNIDCAEHIDGGLVDMGGDALYVVGVEVMVDLRPQVRRRRRGACGGSRRET